MNCVPGGNDSRGPDISVLNRDCSPEIVERPSVVGKIGEERESKAESQVPLDWLELRLIRNLVDGG